MIRTIDCPYCDTYIDIDTESFDLPLDDGDIFEVTCPCCKSVLDVETEITIDFIVKD